MTRITVGELKKAARNPDHRKGTGGSPPVTPIPVAAAAVRRYHRVGTNAAYQYITTTFEQSSYWGPSGRPQARTWAANIVECFDSYAELAGQDERAVFQSGIATDVAVGANAVGVTVDVILIDEGGYVGRHLLWDSPELTQDDAEILAAPIAAALEAELGAGRVVGIEVWQLRSREQILVTADVALARLPEVAEIVARYVSDD
jgi:hypothetical protein